ncbi:MAG: cation:proton antiporter [Vicinamibacterales bacterium]
MRRPIALLIVLALAWSVVNIDAPEGAPLRVTGLALGVALIAAYLAGVLLERLKLPKVTGYLLFGLVCGPYLLNIINRPMARELQVFNGLAVALIAFIAGLEINAARLRPRLASIAQLGAVVLATMYLVLFAVFWFAWPWLPIEPDAPPALRAALAFLLTSVVASFSPTVTIAVVAESRSAGTYTETSLAIVILADLILILMFTLAMELVRWTGGGSAQQVGLLAAASWEIIGSLAFGAIVGALFSFYLRSIGREVTLVLVGVCLLLSIAARALHFEPVLAALAAGLVVENVAPPEGDALKRAVERGALPVLVIFFVAAGASLQVDALATIGLVALAIAVLRGVLAWGGAHLGSRLSGQDGPVSSMLWMSLISQAGVTLGLTLIAAQEFPTWGVPFQTLMVALIAINQLIGPVLFRNALARAGEIGQMDGGAARPH